MRQLAIIKNVGIGLRDVDSPVLWFDVMISEGSGALQVLSWDEAYNLIKAAGVRDVAGLEGKPCWVEVDGSTIHFREVWEKC